MHLFGLTGGIASGKSTVARWLRGRGLPVIDADDLAREVVAKGTAGLDDVVAGFGKAVLAEDGSLDRKALGRIVFADEQARRALNAMIHPRITRRMLERGAALSAAGEPLACYEAALLVENGAQERFRPLVVVACPEEIQLERVAMRDGISLAEAAARVRAQLPLTEKVKVADFVIDTSEALSRSEAATGEVLRALCERVGVDALRYAVPAKLADL